MGRRRKIPDLNPWETELYTGTDRRYIRLGNSLFLSKRFQALTGQEKNVYLCMIMECGGKRTFKFSAASMTKYGINTRTGIRAVEELIKAGFIKKTYCGRIQMNPNEYEFVTEWKRR